MRLACGNWSLEGLLGGCWHNQEREGEGGNWGSDSGINKEGRDLGDSRNKLRSM